MIKGLYIHIPFCDRICTYCDFPKLLTKGQKHEDYMCALIEELKIYEKEVGFSHLQTIYIGGGTPTALSVSQLKPLFDYLHQAIDIARIVEFSIEANPENLTDDRIEYLLAQGVTRFSLGVQTFNEALLKQIGRQHCNEEVKRAVKSLQAHGTTNINLDLIYAIPSQTLADLEADLKMALSLGVEHISAYSLIVEEHTKLYLAYQKDQIELVDNDVEAKMYEYVIDTLKAHGFKHYEISNFAKSKPSLHNQWYWKNEQYIGVGLGAHGYICGVRYHNTRSITAYIQSLLHQQLPRIDVHCVSVEEQIEEEMFLGLRLLEGIDLEDISKKYERDIKQMYQQVLDDLISIGYLEANESRVRLTRKGLLMANDVFEQFLLST